MNDRYDSNRLTKTNILVKKDFKEIYSGQIVNNLIVLHVDADEGENWHKVLLIDLYGKVLDSKNIQLSQSLK